MRREFNIDQRKQQSVDELKTIKGEVVITERLISTGEIIAQTPIELNVVLLQGKQVILKTLTEGSLTTRVNSMAIGNDVGTGTLVQPQAAVDALNESNQSVVFSVPPADFSYSYPALDSVRYRSLIEGPTIMAMYPTLPNVVYSSVVLLNLEGKAIAYKRFPARTISSLVSVDISWTITLI